MKVFWSWQNDNEPESNRHFIRSALDEAVKQAGEELGLEPAERPELDHDTKNTPGMADITSTILKKINESAVFVADLTPIGETNGGKALPNPNVMIELGWALKSLGPDRIIAVMNIHNGYTPDDLPFDIRHRRAMTYELGPSGSKADRAKIRKRLTTELTEALKTNLGRYVEELAEAASFEAVPAKEGDTSVWASYGGEVDFVDTMDISRRVAAIDGPRGYIRIIPAGWKEEIPSVSQIQNAKDGQEVWPVAEGSSGGDYGPCEEGFVRFWHTGNDETANISMWFDETGEFWITHGTAIAAWKDGKKMLRIDSLLRGWRNNLRSAMKALDQHGALAARRVEAGLIDIKGTMWPATMLSYSVPARKPKTIMQRQQRDWSEEAQLQFLTDAYNKIRDNFALPHEDQTALKKITGDK
ncbi:hypothetical protein SAMN05444273_1185 [Litoreibacter ascidiaceicola]|uniref:CD-NTase-associated protein 12/Pycsar effector protein TIR domain-containing protein n=1 Tax=Litoreibacter ascidiaceicola TaxID=1486859 RepID=A0A1M5EZU9_9RHOB|nr:hypothetical protein [Litoreibacter ascidiaceicola]SHF84647.1 hypothetical protein SAMN05444273_1185 [Litoreibacter ascidiaceicola]